MPFSSLTQTIRRLFTPGKSLLAFLAISLIVCVLVYHSEPMKSPWLPPCLFHRWTGLHCPGCGNTRALHALVHGHLCESLRYNILLIPYFLLICALLYKPSLSYKVWIVYPTLAVTLAFFVLRNLPYLPFSLLAP